MAAESDPKSLKIPGTGDLRAPRLARLKKLKNNYKLPEPIGGRTLSGINPPKTSVAGMVKGMRKNY
jgi:hypothetical protein